MRARGTGGGLTNDLLQIDDAWRAPEVSEHADLPCHVRQLIDVVGDRTGPRPGAQRRGRPRPDECEPALPLAADEFERMQLPTPAVCAQLHDPTAAFSQRANAHIAVVRDALLKLGYFELRGVDRSRVMRCVFQ